MGFSHAFLKELIELFDGSDLVTLHIKTEDGEVTLSSQSTPLRDPDPAASNAAPRVSTAANADAPEAITAAEPTILKTAAAPAPPPPQDDALLTVTAPALGVFYRSPRPDQPPYVKDGSHVDPETTVGLIEAMKVYTAVAAGVSGTVREVVAENNELVEFGQVLLRIEPDAGGEGR